MPLDLPRKTIEKISNQIIWMCFDTLSQCLAILFTEKLLEREFHYEQWIMIALLLSVRLLIFVHFGTYRSILRYSGTHTALVAGIGVGSGSFAIIIVSYFLNLENTGGLGRVFLVLEGMLSFLFLCGARFISRAYLERKNIKKAKKVLIYGAGRLGEIVIRELSRHPQYNPVGFIDDDPYLLNSVINGHKIFGGFDLLQSINSFQKPEMLILAINNFPQDKIRYVFSACMKLGIQVKIVKGIADSIGGSSSVNIEDIALVDLLSRPLRILDKSKVDNMLNEKCVLITGAGGSIGSELAKQIAKAGIIRLVLIDHSEFNLYQIDSDIKRRFPKLAVFSILDNLSDISKLEDLFRNYSPQVVFHAAAYKHVPLVEENPFLGMLNNLGGFSNLLSVAVSMGVERLISISTDKAVHPTSIMGASKRACEVLLQNYCVGTTTLCAVRFGNVLGSSGSVIPLFLDQIRKGGPITVTHPEVTRYFMLIPEAVELVLHAGSIAKHQEIFILDMGEPVKILDLARQLIYMTGNVPDKDIQISFTGLRPGEKLFEELLLGETEIVTEIEGITIAKSTIMDQGQVTINTNKLLIACKDRNIIDFNKFLALVVPEWVPSDFFINVFDDYFPNSKSSYNKKN